VSFVDARKLVAGENPFVGLRPFGIADADVFFGREAQIATVLERLRGTRFLAVVGASGSGKSSLVLAGLIPALPREGAERTGPSWRMAVMRPGAAPVAALARVLARTQVLGAQADDPDVPRAAMLERLQRDEFGLVDLVQRAELRKDENLLVVVDQFDELFRFATDTDRAARATEAAAFVKLLLTAAASKDVPVSVAIAIRSDFIGDCARFDGLPEAVNDGLFLVPRLTPDDVWRAIEQPVRRRGEVVTPQLVARLLDDATAGADQLPKLEHALMRTWDAWSNDHAAGEPLDERHYEAIGEVRGALSKHANEIYDALEPRQQQLAERLFRCLTARDGENRDVRRPMPVSAVLAVTAAKPGELEQLMRIYAAPAVSFLTASGPLSNPTTILDVTHESLMRLWDRLRAWVADEAESGKTYRKLVDDAAAKRAHWVDPELAVGEAWLAKHRTSVNPAWAARYDVALAALPADELAGSRAAHERFAAALAFLNASAAAPRRSAGMIIALVSVLFLAATALAIVGFTKYNQTVAERHRADELDTKARAAISQADASRRIADQERERAKTRTAAANQRMLEAARIVKAADAEKRRRAAQRAKASPKPSPRASASPRPTATPRPTASPRPTATPHPSPSPHRSASPRPAPTAKPATPRPIARSAPARSAASAALGANASCRRAVDDQRLAASASITRRAAYDASVAGLAENGKCENKAARIVNEGYLRSTLAAAEHALGIGDWKADLDRANQLLMQCETLIELQTTKAPADCAAQRRFNEQAATEFTVP